MYRLEKEFRFEAAHKLPLHDGKCRRLHGHSFRAVLVLESDRLQGGGGPSTDMVQDYEDLSAVMRPVLENYLDHHFLNESLGLRNPTAEAVAAWIFGMVKPHVPPLAAVRLYETPTACAEYRP